MKMSSGWVIRRGLSRKRKVPLKEACGQRCGGPPHTHTYTHTRLERPIYIGPPWPPLGGVLQESWLELAGVRPTLKTESVSRFSLSSPDFCHGMQVSRNERAQ